MRIKDVMTIAVVTVGPETPLKRVAELLAGHRISGLPVVDTDGAVLGVVSEADLLVKERGTPLERSTWLSRLTSSQERRELAKRKARTAGEAMTGPAITIAPFRPLATAAREMLEYGINRLPVVSNGRLVGIVSRADLVRAFARSDEDTAADVRQQVEDFLAVAGDSPDADVVVDDGRVTLSGSLRRRSVAEALPSFVGKIPGVVEVQSELTWVDDDAGSPWREALRHESYRL
jgi:CBS domain-containing protein